MRFLSTLRSAAESRRSPNDDVRHSNTARFASKAPRADRDTHLAQERSFSLPIAGNSALICSWRRSDDGRMQDGISHACERRITSSGRQLYGAGCTRSTAPEVQLLSNEVIAHQSLLCSRANAWREKPGADDPRYDLH